MGRVYTFNSDNEAQKAKTDRVMLERTDEKTTSLAGLSFSKKKKKKSNLEVDRRFSFDLSS